MANKTPYKVMSTIQILRTNGDIVERNINLTALVQSAALDYLANEYGLTPAQVNNLVTEWRIHTIWIDEPEV